MTAPSRVGFTDRHPFTWWWLTGGVVALLLAGFGFVVFQNSHRNAVVWADVPTVAPTPTHTAPCDLSDGLSASPTGGAGRVWLDDDPTGAVALWLPGFNLIPCTATLTHLDAARAQALVTAVRSAPLLDLSGTVSCPSENGTEVALFFRYAGHAKGEVVQLHVSGCAGIEAPGRSSREITTAVDHLLRPGAPAGWGAYIG